MKRYSGRKWVICFCVLLNMLVFHAPARISAAEEVTIPGTFHQTDARWLFDQTNELRVTPGISIKNSDGSEKYYNQAGSLYLEKYTYDYALEQIAMQRAAELALYCSHTRPNGESYSSLSWNGVTSDGENIGWGTVGYADRDWVFTSWCETDKNYWSQSHRRNMLDEEFTAMGAACFEYKGYLYWVQEFGVAPSGAASVKALDGYGIRTIPYLEKYVSSSKFTGSETVTLNAMGGNVKTSSFTVDYGGTYPALEEPVKEGFRFDGWYTLDSGGDLIKKGSTVKIFGNHTLFAKWAYTLTSPELVSAVSTESGVKIQWNPVTGASRYRIYRKVSGGTWKSLGTSSKTTYTDKNALSGELCYYTVRCITESGESASGYRSPGLKITYYKTPDAPVLTYTSGGIKVNPEEVPGAVNYRIYRKEGNEDYRALADTNELLYIDKNVESGKEYSYTIAVLTADGKTELTGYRKIGATILYYNAPMIESVRLVKNTCEITWTLVPGIEYYRVYRRQGTGDWVSIGRTKDTVYTDTETKSGAKYSYRIQCVADDGKTGVSARSAIKEIRFLRVPPMVNLSVEEGAVTVSWKKVTAAQGYYVYRKEAGGAWKRIKTVNGIDRVKYKDVKVQAGVTYSYCVRSFCSDGISAFDSGTRISAKAR